MTYVDFIWQAPGFLLQTLPIALLCFVPFEKRELLLPRKILYYIITAGVLIFSIGFVLMHFLISVVSRRTHQFLRSTSNLYMCVFVLLFVIFFFYVIRAAAAKKILVLTLLIHYEAILFTAVSVLNGIIQDPLKQKFPIIYGPQDIFLYMTGIIITCPVVYVFLKHVVKAGFPYMTNPILHRGCIYLLSALLLYSFCIFSLTNYEFYYGVTGYPLLLFLLAFILTDAILYYMFFSEVHLSAENRELQDQLRTFDEKYRQISANVAESRRARHDIRHHLNVIGALHREGKDEELDRYLEQYEAFCQELEKMPLSGYSSLDSILRYYIQQAREEKITVHTDLQPLPNTMRFDAIDLTVLLGNLMENAIESCRKLPVSEDRFLHIWIRLENVSLLMQVENACSAEGPDSPDFSDGREFISTKHTVLRGQGLKSIRCIAGKYGGSAEFKRTGGTFTARIVLNLP
ncbi:MAG TPA: GHKL domain-containing protein [Candidatus Anaerobutyricum stercoris]|uniref:GHKL domain-containing protein n=1 Tax=Candidatus Anaerobutyricum stercoris TaxID=2838457 RepID=A0A9D2J8C5_9FIRM|nr:GHKL domain-containing protein [Candidatus Anaerobutyricum stercoris]